MAPELGGTLAGRASRPPDRRSGAKALGMVSRLRVERRRSRGLRLAKARDLLGQPGHEHLVLVAKSPELRQEVHALSAVGRAIHGVGGLETTCHLGHGGGWRPDDREEVAGRRTWSPCLADVLERLPFLAAHLAGEVVGRADGDEDPSGADGVDEAARPARTQLQVRFVTKADVVEAMTRTQADRLAEIRVELLEIAVAVDPGVAEKEIGHPTSMPLISKNARDQRIAGGQLSSRTPDGPDDSVSPRHAVIHVRRISTTC